MKKGAIRWLFQVPGRKKLYILALVLVQATQGVSGVFYALFLRAIVDAAVGGDRPGFFRGILFTALLMLAQLLLSALIRWLTERAKAEFENIFKKRLLHTLLHRDFLMVSAVHSAEWLNRLTNDAVVVAQSYVEVLPGFVGKAVRLVSALVMIILLEPRFAMILIPGGVLLILLTWLFRKVLKKLHKRIQEADGRLRIFLQERLGSMLMIRSHAAEDDTEQTAAERMREHLLARMKRNHFSNLGNFGFGFAICAMYMLGIGWCGYGILKGTVSFGTLTAVMQLISQIQSPFVNISGYLPRYYAMLASAERLMEAEQFADSGAEARSLEEMTEFYKDRLGAFGLHGAEFTYYPASESAEGLSREQMPVVLKNTSLEIKKGEYVAFTGHSGCGKSTVLKLLMCVYSPDAGERYYIDTDGGRAELTSEYRRLFAYVPQGNQLMSGTIRDVVSFADHEAGNDDERLYTALRIACADEFVSELPNGVDTLLGERGTGLSEGQMQRLAIARAVFSGSPVLLLDESTSALDAQTEHQLLMNLRNMTDKTVVIVTHRKAALEICDRVLEFTESGLTIHDS